MSTSTHKTTRRTPAQDRSRKRVDAILQAAKSLIAEKGSARLKIHDIAERAEVTPASIYQYFPNKNAITLALARETFDRTHEQLLGNLPNMTDENKVFEVLREIVEQFYQAYLDDPALYDIWISVTADKSLTNLDIEDSRRNASLIYECLKQFYDESKWDQLQHASFLLAHLAGAAVRMALNVGVDEGRALVDSFKALINPGFMDSLLSQSNASLSRM